MKNTRTFKTVLTERAKAAGCRTPSEYRAFIEACRYTFEKGFNRHGTFEEWLKEESFFD